MTMIVQITSHIAMIQTTHGCQKFAKKLADIVITVKSINSNIIYNKYIKCHKSII